MRESGDRKWIRLKNLKARIGQIQAYFSSPEEMKQLEEQVLKRKKKREWQKRKRKEDYVLKQEAEDRKNALHKKIDEWRSQIIAQDEAKRRADSLKHEAGGVLGEVKRKQTDATKAVELLKALRKLREARKQEAEVKGVYLKPTEEENRRFDERVTWLESVMIPRRELYETEERLCGLC
ncbi:programmed cell death [Desmophyllum pertusum]|uniref:Programmed cell death n=1 Tax=Desmophyllum pertusum TaxID=174260 RepID=A0A9W9ZPW8_9CNID|nr:programmed cell death [Desmophyllum pertusum]